MGGEKNLTRPEEFVKQHPLSKEEDLSGEYFENQTGLLVVVAEHREGGLPGAIMNI
jgi:hypothetical protein